MKQIFSILFSLLVFLSGMNISLATHYCRGEIAATKVSLSGEKASCGMEKFSFHYPAKGIQIKSNCCKDEISVYATDNNYISSGFHFMKPIKNVLQIFLMPVKHSLARFDNPLSAIANTGPPGHLFTAAMSQSGICVFRI
jgi:hypothetical protein